jgi:chemotaxis protein MotB
MSDHAVKELVIIRHRGDDHGEGHHGGVWKIAFADFMTAMMAFFLVMWLINASNEATKKAVASYFNPIKLADVTSNPKGVQELRYGASSQDSVRAECEVKTREKPHEATPGQTEHALGSATEAADEPIGADAAAVQPASGMPASGLASDNEGLVFADGLMPGGAKPSPASTEQSSHLDASLPAGNDPLSAVKPVPVATAKEQQFAAAQIEAQSIRNALDQEMRTNEAKLGPALVVRVASDGVLISLTDHLGFSMFQVGSSVPNAAMTEALRAIGRVLSQRSGLLIIRGHTDSRQFHAESNDNWRLSSDRAHIAFENLIKGGVDERRFERIEGFADRQLLLTNDPMASENRRIEILMRPMGQP